MGFDEIEGLLHGKISTQNEPSHNSISIDIQSLLTVTHLHSFNLYK